MNGIIAETKDENTVDHVKEEKVTPEKDSNYVHLDISGDNYVEQIPCQFCDGGPAKVAAQTCLTCQAFYCVDCLYVTHPQKVPFINHMIVAADTMHMQSFTKYSADDSLHSNRINPTTASCSNHCKVNYLFLYMPTILS